MNMPKSKTLAIAGVAMLGAAALVVAQEEAGKPTEVKPAPQVVPKLKPAEFLSQIGRDSAEVRNAGQVTLSYADVVERTLPTVVSIGTYSTKSAPGGRMGPNMNEDDL